MLNQIQKKSTFKRATAKLSIFVNSWLGRHIIRPLLVALPPFVIIGYLRFNEIKIFVNDQLGQTFANFLSENVAPLYLATFIYTYFVLALFGLLSSNSTQENEIDARGFMALWKTTDQVVSAKHDRFTNTAKKVLNNTNKLSQTQVFNEITKPEQQIALLVERLKDLFEYFDNNNETSFRVRLIQIDNGVPISWFYYTPQNEFPTTTLRDLKSPISALGKCLKTKKIVIIEDIAKAARKNNYVSHTESENGSLICYPIINSATGNIVYVVTVRADTSKYLLNSKRDFYKWIFKHFILRINLEHNLLIIKEGTTNEPAN